MPATVNPPVEHAWPSGFRINPRGPDLPPELVEAFRAVPTAHASDCLGRNVGAIGLWGFHGPCSESLCGPAVTVRIRPGDNLMIHVAVAMARPGDVIVVDGGGDVSQAVVGGLMRTTAMSKGIRGFVIDGALRDTAEWALGKVFAYAKGFTHRGPSKEGPGEINVPISCAGMVVTPGDLVLGDGDGVVTVPHSEVVALLPRVRLQAQYEEHVRAENAAGGVDPERFNSILRAKGCPV
jgi:regulator of RNase E activity RraA